MFPRRISTWMDLLRCTIIRANLLKPMHSNIMEQDLLLATILTSERCAIEMKSDAARAECETSTCTAESCQNHMSSAHQKSPSIDRGRSFGVFQARKGSVNVSRGRRLYVSHRGTCTQVTASHTLTATAFSQKHRCT